MTQEKTKNKIEFCKCSHSKEAHIDKSKELVGCMNCNCNKFRRSMRDKKMTQEKTKDKKFNGMDIGKGKCPMEIENPRKINYTRKDFKLDESQAPKIIPQGTVRSQENLGDVSGCPSGKTKEAFVLENPRRIINLSKKTKEEELKELRCPKCGDSFLTEKQSKPFAKTFDKLIENIKKEERERIIGIIDKLRLSIEDSYSNGEFQCCIDELEDLKQKIGEKEK